MDFPLSFLRSQGVRLDQYFGLWCMESTRFSAMLNELQRGDLIKHAEQGQLDAEVRLDVVAITPSAGANDQVSTDHPNADGAPVVGSRSVNIGIVSVEGVMTKRGDSFSVAGSTILARQALRKAARDEKIDAILYRTDSPGGTSAGTGDLARDLAMIATHKPVYAFIEDLGASAAYFVSSQATRVYANEEVALVGAIGTWIGLYDYSKKAKKEGIKAIVVKNGEMKGLGFPGTEITEAQREELQRIVTATQQTFTEAVARGRSMNIADVPTDGRIFTASEALSLGLIDGIASIDEVLQMLAQEVLDDAPDQESSVAADAPHVSTTPENSVVMAKQSNTKDPSGIEQETVSGAETGTPLTDASQDVQAQLEEMRHENEALRQMAEATEKAHAQTAADLATERAERARAQYADFAHAHRQRITADEHQVARCTEVMEALATYDALGADNIASMLDQFRALVEALPVLYNADIVVTEDGDIVSSIATVGPAGSVVDQERQAYANEVTSYAEKNGLTFEQALQLYPNAN